MRIFYTFGIHLYTFVVTIVALFNEKAKLWINGRKYDFSKFPEVKNKDVYWFHCASLGEFDQGLPLMNIYKKNFPDSFILVTFFSPSGMQHYHKRQNPVDFAMYLPIDTKKNATWFLKKFNPKAAFFIKYEFWHHFILQAKKQQVKVYSISTLLRPSHRFFKWYGGFFRKTLNLIDFFFVQNQETAQLLEKINIHKLMIVGDTRFDRVLENSLKTEANNTIESFLEGEKAIIYGSTWPEDEQIILNYCKENPQQKFIIAPHDISMNHIKSIEQKLGDFATTYSKYNKDFNKNILILDTIGHLASAYKYGKIAYVGGGFSGMLHNILEPAVFGLPVLFGPKHHRFPEAKLFLEKRIGFEITNSNEFKNCIEKIERSIEEMKTMAIKVVEENKGASQKIYAQINC